MTNPMKCVHVSTFSRATETPRAESGPEVWFTCRKCNRKQLVDEGCPFHIGTCWLCCGCDADDYDEPGPYDHLQEKLEA
jgi:hypothetical protein